MPLPRFEMVADRDWRKLPTETSSPWKHVSESDALSRCVTQPTLWWHSSDVPALILGAGQPLTDIDMDACHRVGVSVGQRNSGGTAVYASIDLLGLDVALPPLHPLILSDVVESYRWFGETWVDALQRLDIPAHVVQISEVRTRRFITHVRESGLQLACFGSFSPYEVMHGEQKIVGLSQVRRGGRELLQAGVYLSFEAHDMVNLLAVEDRPLLAAQLNRVATGLRQIATTEITATDVRAAFEAAITARYGITLTDGGWTEAERQFAVSHEPSTW